MKGTKPVRVVEPGRTELFIVGVGGTGGYVLQQAARLLYALKCQGRPTPPVTLIDGDTVEKGNLLRQYFLPPDVGRNKATALAERYGLAYGIRIDAYPHYITEDTPIADAPHQRRIVPEGAIVVGCVDNAPTRRILHDALSGMDHVIYLDSGNAGARIPEDPHHIDRYELAGIRESGWEGQVVCGVRFGRRDILPFPGEVFPDLLEGDEDHPADVSCGEAATTNPQRLMTNLMAATSVMMYLHTLLADGTIVLSRTFFDARKGYTRSDTALDSMLEVSV